MFRDALDSHWLEIGINALGAYLGFLGAAILYLIQVADDERSANIEIINRHKEHLRYFAGVIEDVIKYAKNQAKALDEISDAIKRQPSVVHQLAFIASDSIGRLNRADSEDTFHAYNMLFGNNSSHEKYYKDIISQADFLKANLGSLKESFSYYRDHIYSRQLKLKDSLQMIADETAFLLKDIRQPGPASAFAKYAPTAIEELNLLLVNYISLNSRLVPFETYFEEFIEPLKHWLPQYDMALPLSGSAPECAFNLVRLTKGASVALTDLKLNSNDFIKAFNSQKITAPAVKLEALVEDLNKVIK